MRFAFILKIATLILLRSWRATAVLSFMVITAVAALVFLSALAVGTNDAMIRNSTGLFSGHISISGISAGDAGKLQVAGVEQVLLRRHRPVILSTNSSLEAVTLLGIDPLQEQKATAFWKKTVQGRYPVANSQEIYLSQDSAKRLKLQVGDSVTLRTHQSVVLKRLTVSGIYKTGISQLDQGLAFCPATALPPGEQELSVALFLTAEAPIDEVVSTLRTRLPTASFTPWMEFMPDLKQLIDLDYICMAIVITLVFAIVSVGISCTFLIFTLKNLREHGIMKAMGFMAGDTALLLVSQVSLLTVFAATAGTLLGVLTVSVFAQIGIDIGAFTSHNQYFSVSGMLYPRLTGLALFTPPLVAVVFGLAAAIWPIVTIIRKNPADILRSV
jgi:ABC-type lipoprotein release transport system permease subunit